VALVNATTKERVKDLLQITGSSQNDVLDRLIASTSQRIEDFIDRPLHKTARTEEYSIKPRQNTLFLRAYPLAAQTSISSIKIAGDWDFASVSAVDSGDYHVDLDSGMVHFNYFPITNYLGNNMATAPNVVQIVYTGGLVANTNEVIDFYPAIASACEMQVIANWRRRDQPMMDTVKIDEYTSTVAGPLEFLADVRQALMPYRRMRFGQ
jgi:hypothetical protein